MPIKKYLCICFLSFTVINIYGININGGNPFGDISITDTTLTFRHESSEVEEYTVTWETINNLQYMSFEYKGTFMDRYNSKIEHGNKRYLVLHGSYGVLFYNEDNKCIFNFNFGRTPVDGSNLSTVSAKTELKEGNTVYSAQNLLNASALVPWAEGVSGSGIGERIRIEVEPKTRNNSGWNTINSLAVSNGFVDYNRPYLYENNNRVKKLRVYNVETNEFFDFDIEDTPNIQQLRYRFSSPAQIIDIEILEIYNGTKWDDTCINFILPLIW